MKTYKYKNIFKLNFFYQQLSLCLLALYVTTSFSQNKFPLFKTLPITIAFPKFIEGCIPDSLNTKNDSLIYKLKGQIFKTKEGHIQTISEGFNGITKEETPWETLTELLAAYQKKDTKKIIALYSTNSQSKISDYVTGEKAKDFFDNVSKVKKINIILGFEYKNGYFSIAETDLGIVSNYFIKENGLYKLSALDDKSALIWNLSLYCKYKPEPFLKPVILTTIDTLKYSETKEFSVKLNKKSNWLIICENNPGSPIFFRGMDNFPDLDLNNKEGIITINIAGKRFAKKGLHTLYITESNFPVVMFAKPLITYGLKINVFIK